MPVSTQYLRTTIEAASAGAKRWFEERTTTTTRAQFEKRGALSDDRTGAVYAYFTSEGRAVYVGQTKRGVKARLYDQTSPHKKKPWWPTWAYMRFLGLSDKIDRLLLEFLLVVAYQPTENRDPAAKSIESLFSAADVPPAEPSRSVARASCRNGLSLADAKQFGHDDFSPWMRFSEIPRSLRGHPGVYEIRSGGKLLKVGIGGNVYTQLRNHARSRQSGLKGKRGPGPWTDPSEVESKSSVLAMHLYFDSAIAPELDLKSQDGRRTFLATRCEVRFRVTPSRNDARAIESMLEAPDRYRYVGDVRIR